MTIPRIRSNLTVNPLEPLHLPSARERCSSTKRSETYVAPFTFFGIERRIHLIYKMLLRVWVLCKNKLCNVNKMGWVPSGEAAPVWTVR